MADELKNIKSDNSIISENCVSFVEESAFALNAIDEEFEDLMEACGAGSDAPETDTEGNGEDVTTEAVVNESIKDFGKGAVEFIQGIWAKIKAAFEKFIKILKDKYAEIKSKKLDAKLAKFDTADIKADAKIGDFHPNKNIGTTKWMGVLEDAAMQYQTEDLEELPSQIVDATVLGGKSSKNSRADIKTMRKMLKEAFLGEVVHVTGENFKSVKSDVEAVIKGSAMSEVKKQYNESRKVINDLIKSYKQSAKSKENTKEKKKENRNDANAARRIGQLLFTGHMVQFDAIRQQLGEAARICAYVARHQEKKDKKEETKATGEAAIFAW